MGGEWMKKEIISFNFLTVQCFTKLLITVAASFLAKMASLRMQVVFDQFLLNNARNCIFILLLFHNIDTAVLINSYIKSHQYNEIIVK
jgi:hypothetical protein